MAKSNIVLEICKREKYIQAWLEMYKSDREIFNDPMYDGVNPMANKTPLKTETDNIAVVAYDIDLTEMEQMENFGKGFIGKPVGIFSMLITNSKNIGKQFVVHKLYQNRGIGKGMLLALEKELKDRGFDQYYIGCSSMSARILKSFGVSPYNEDFDHDLFKFTVDLNRPGFDDQVKRYLEDRFEIRK